MATHSARFEKPDIDEVIRYCNSVCKSVNPKAWFDYYESNGWLVGKYRMKDWRASVRSWERRACVQSAEPMPPMSRQSRNDEPTHIGDMLPEVLAKYSIKAIQTRYDGILFRSRIEARWAVFFNSLGLDYEYEKEGYDLGDGKAYLPDFWLPSLDAWIEIKGADPEEDACDLAHRLSVASEYRVYVFFGGIVMPENKWSATNAYAFFPDGTADNGYHWCECQSCGQLGIHYQGRSDRLPCKQPYQDARLSIAMSEGGGCERTGGNYDKGYNTNSPGLMEAYAAARSERFGR